MHHEVSVPGSMSTTDSYSVIAVAAALIWCLAGVNLGWCCQIHVVE